MSIKDRLLESGYSGSELASKLSVSVATIEAWLNGTRAPSLDELYDLARLLRTNFRQLALEAGYSHYKIDAFIRKIKGIYDPAYGPSQGPSRGPTDDAILGG